MNAFYLDIINKINFLTYTFRAEGQVYVKPSSSIQLQTNPYTNLPYTPK